MWWYSRGIRACFRFRSLSIFCIFSSFVAFALYKADEKQDAPATPATQRGLHSVSCILSLLLFCHVDAVFVFVAPFFVSMGPAFVFHAAVFAFVSQASLKTELGELKISVAKRLGALYIINWVSFSSTESA